jgi:hypothetical protein
MDLTTKLGRQQAYAAGGEIADTAALIEDALAADERERNEQALEALDDADVDVIFGSDRSEEFDRLLDDLAEQLGSTDHALYQKFVAWQTEALQAQARSDQMLDHVRNILKGQ